MARGLPPSHGAEAPGREGVMSHPARFGAKIGAAVVAGLLGFCIGPFVGTAVAALVGDGPGGPERAEVGRVFGMGAGLIGGALLGAFLVGRPVVARWCLATA